MSNATQTHPTRKKWSTPQLNKIGTIKEVAANLSLESVQSPDRS